MRGEKARKQGTGNRVQGTGNRVQGTGYSVLATRLCPVEFFAMFADVKRSARRLSMMGGCLLSVAFFALTTTGFAQGSPQPQPVPMPPPIAAPVDTPYPGTIALTVNLTNTLDRVVTVHETIPVKAGDLVLLYPQWLPGTHSPRGPID